MTDVLPTQLYETINAFLACLWLTVALIFGRYLFIEFRLGHWSRRRSAGAMAIFTMAFGSVFLRSWIYYARHAIERHVDASWMGELPAVLVPVASTLILATGLLCLIRVFTPDDWGERGWVYCLLICIALTAALVLI